MDLKNLALDENFLWASFLWGTVASGYLIYGWRQKASIPLAVGAAMTLMSFIGPNALIDDRPVARIDIAAIERIAAEVMA